MIMRMYVLSGHTKIRFAVVDAPALCGRATGQKAEQKKLMRAHLETGTSFFAAAAAAFAVSSSRTVERIF